MLAVLGIGTATLRGAYLIEVDADGLDNGIIAYSPDFSFGGDTTTAIQSGAASAVGLTGGDSIFGGNGSSDTYVFTYAPDSQIDNHFLDPGTPLGVGNYASGATGGGPGRYAVYASWLASTNVTGGLTKYRIDTAGGSTSFSADQNGSGNVWVKLGEIDYTSGPITVTQTATSNTYVSMRAAGVLFELMSDGTGAGYTGPPGPVTFGQGQARSFGLAYKRNRTEAQSTHFAFMQSPNLMDWSTSDLKLVSITDFDAGHELVTFRSMAPMATMGRQFIKVRATPKMAPTAPYVAITHDDGPHPDRTPRLLDILAARNIRATFYVVGTNAQKYPHLIRRMINEGHEIGNHTVNHPRLTDLTTEAVIAEVAGCRDAVVAAGTIPTATIRPPYGAVNDSLRALFLSEFGYPTVLWDVDSRDWDTSVSDAEVVNTILTEADHGEIILTHDVHERTILVMPAVLDGLLAEGFSFVTVSELLKLQGK